MAFAAKDGKQFTNRPPMMAHNRSVDRSAGMTERNDPLQQPTDGGESQDGSAVASEHGPAVEVNIMHGEGGHQVRSKHPDGHEHESTHGSADEAHDHGKKLAGGGIESSGDMGGDEAEYE